MYSTTSIAKHTKKTGKIVGTHQLLNQAAHKILAKHLSGKYFPSNKDICHFEGVRGPDGLKSKDPGIDDPSHMFGDGDGTEIIQQVLSHYHNLVKALKTKNHERAAFEAAWSAHKLVDALTPAHHFPLNRYQEELMTDDEFVKIFGEPIKGIMKGRNILETARNNWLYWGAKGLMSRHIAYEYGVVMITTAMPRKKLLPEMHAREFLETDPEKIIQMSLDRIHPAEMYRRFQNRGWTVDLALDTRRILLPELVRAIVLLWNSAAIEAYGIAQKATKKSANKPTKAKSASKKGKNHENH